MQKMLRMLQCFILTVCYITRAQNILLLYTDITWEYLNTVHKNVHVFENLSLNFP